MDRQKKARIKKLYGLTSTQWDKMFKDQGGVCWICQTMPKSKKLCIDHEHIPKYKTFSSEKKKKYVRGLLCFSCNTAFARIERRKTPRILLGRIVEYFKVFRLKGDPDVD